MGSILSEQRTRYDLTSADTKIIGFEFQYFYFINELLKIDEDQTIGFEVKDDVHIDLPCGKAVLIQLKHTIQKNAKGLPINLTEKDDDLWKTLSNWSKVISDSSKGKKTVKSQICFLEKTKFILATNKFIIRNKAIAQINKLKKKKVTINDYKNYLYGLHKSTKDIALQMQINDVIQLDSKVLELFINNLEIINTGDCLIKEIKKNIQKKMIASNRVNDVFNDLFSELKQDFFASVKSGKHQTITYDEWIKKYTCIFEKHRQTTLQIRRFEPVFPPDLFQQNFIKELINIGELEPDDIAQVSEFSEFMLMVKMNLESWYEDGLITNIDKESFHDNVFSIWRNMHKKAHRSTKKNLSLDKDNAINCLDEVRGKNLKVLSTELGIDLSNGEFYYLSNIKRIGWKFEWEEQYRHERNTHISK